MLANQTTLKTNLKGVKMTFKGKNYDFKGHNCQIHRGYSHQYLEIKLKEYNVENRAGFKNINHFFSYGKGLRDLFNSSGYTKNGTKNLINPGLKNFYSRVKTK
tara:strand:- start:94 stop:402 length:309 start_codon:yes stop_codon:yes gene_type:complete